MATAVPTPGLEKPGYGTVAGSNPYTVAAKVAVTVANLKRVLHVQQIKHNSPYHVRVSSISGQIVTLAVDYPQGPIAAAEAQAAAAVAAHAAADIQAAAAVADHPAADIAGALDDHPAHGHDITTVAPAGAGTALTAPAVAGPIEDAGGGATLPGAVDALAADQAHTAVGGVAPGHTYGAGVAAAHAYGAGTPIPGSPSAEIQTADAVNLSTFTFEVFATGF